MAAYHTNPVIVVDNGSATIKAGLSTSETVDLMIPTVLGKPRSRYASKYPENSVFHGKEAIRHQQHLSMTSPIEHGHIENWNEVTELWEKMFEGLQCSPSEHAILHTVPALCSTNHCEKLAEIMFEKFDCPSLHLTVGGVLALYGAGRLTGISLDIGEGITQSLAIYDGYLEKASVMRSDFGGQELTMYLQRILCNLGYPLTTRDDYRYVQEIKEKHCFCALASDDGNSEDDTVTYELPDGNMLRDNQTRNIVLGYERRLPCEAIFNPQICERDSPPLTDIFWTTQQASPMETRRFLLNNIVLCGGSTQFKGFTERLEREIKNTAPVEARKYIKLVTEGDRMSILWLGGKIFVNTGDRASQQDMWITRNEYDESGLKIVLAKTTAKF